MEGSTNPVASKSGKEVKDVAAKPAVELPMNHPDAPHITIHLQKGEGDDEKGGVFVSVNGNDFMVPRAVDVSVPVPVFEVLSNSKRMQLSEDGSESFEVNRFSMSVKSAGSPFGRA